MSFSLDTKSPCESFDPFHCDLQIKKSKNKIYFTFKPLQQSRTVVLGLLHPTLIRPIRPSSKEDWCSSYPIRLT